MRILISSLAVMALCACNQPKVAEADTNGATVTNDVAAANNMMTPAEASLNGTTWTYQEKGKDVTESIDASGNYVAWSGDEHLDHGTMRMAGDKACFTSAMTKDGEMCWTTAETPVGQSMESVSDKGEKLTVTRVDYVEAPAA